MWGEFKINNIADIIVLNYLQLLVTGLKLDEDTDLLLADLFIGTTTKRFSNKASHYEMMEKYKNTVQGQIYRKYDFKLICKKAKQKGIDKVATVNAVEQYDKKY